MSRHDAFAAAEEWRRTHPSAVDPDPPPAKGPPMRREPVLILVGALVGIVDATLVVLAVPAVGILEPAVAAALAAWVTTVGSIIAAALRGQVWSPDGHDSEVRGG